MSCCRKEAAGKTKNVLGYSKDKKIGYHILEKDQLKEALDVLEKGFYPDEPVCSFIQCSKSPEAVKEMNLLMIDVAKDNITLIAVDTETNEIVGVCFNKIQTEPKPGELSYFEKFKTEVCKNKIAKSLIDFMSEVDGEVNIFEKFNVDKAAEMVFLAVAPTHRHRGIGLDLVTHSLSIFKSKSVAPVACMIGTSTYTQHIGKKLNFNVLAEVPYKIDNICPSVFKEVTMLHDRSILFAKKI